MKLLSIRIENYRSFKDQTIPLDEYTCFVGANGAGKSTVLCALNLFFQNVTSSTPNVKDLDEEDFHNRDTTVPVRITLTFDSLSEPARVALKDYTRQGKLIVTAEAIWNPEKRVASVKQHGQRLGMKDFAESYFAKASDGAKVAELKDAYTELRKKYEDLPAATTGPKMAEALQQFEASHPDQCVHIQSDDEFYGANGSGKLNSFVQWVYVPAVKDAQEEGEESKKSALGQLLARTVRAKTNFGEKIASLRKETYEKFEGILRDNAGVLDEITGKLKTRLAEWSHSDTNLDLRWLSDPGKSVQVTEPIAGVYTGEGEFTGKLARMGHGLQRSYLLALLTELASVETENAPTLILGCEEPELYQHPPQARRLADVFRTLASGNTQVLVTTHSPYFVSGPAFEHVRLIRKAAGHHQATIHHSSNVAFTEYLNKHSHLNERPKPAGMRAKINQSLQPNLNEMFFCRFPIFVEGLEDLAFITAALHLYGLWDEFHSLGCHIIPSNGKGHLIHPVALANLLTIPYFLVFDCDGDAEEKHKSRHEPENKTLFSLLGVAIDDPFPKADVILVNCCAWEINMGDRIDSDFEPDALGRFKDKARDTCGHAAKLEKNSIFIGEWLSHAHEDGKQSKTLEILCRAIIDAASVGFNVRHIAAVISLPGGNTPGVTAMGSSVSDVRLTK